MNRFLWGVYPYICIVLFLVVPVIRMRTRPFSWSTRASGLFAGKSLGRASRFLHWGLLLLLLGHLAGLLGGVMGSAGLVSFFYWIGLFGGLLTLLGSCLALIRRYKVPEVRAMSQREDFIIHFFIIAIVALALFQVIFHRIFGIAYTASSWAGSLWTFTPQPELMASVSLITKLHVLLALTFFAYFPFTKLVHVWAVPLNYFTRPYQSMRTQTNRFERKWEFKNRSDKSWLVYYIGIIAAVFLIAGALTGSATPANVSDSTLAQAEGSEESAAAPTGSNTLMGGALFVSQCARCHGLDGAGDGPGANSPTFAALPRNFVGGHYHFVSTTTGLASDQDLFNVIEDGLPLAGMPGFGELSDEQIWSIVAVLDQMWEDRPDSGESLVVPERGEVTDRVVGEGREGYEFACVSCHGEGGEGDGPMVGMAELQDWAGRDITPANLATGALKGGRSAEELYLRIAAGVGGGPEQGYLMPAFSSQLSDDEIWAIVAFLESEILPDE